MWKSKTRSLKKKNAQQQKHIDEIDTLLEKVRGIIILPSLSQIHTVNFVFLPKF